MTYTVIEDAYLEKPGDDWDAPWESEVVARAGDVVHRYMGATYGVVTGAGVACSHGGPFETPFFEIARSNLRENPCGSA